jgi:hypothetical protein
MHHSLGETAPLQLWQLIPLTLSLKQTDFLGTGGGLTNSGKEIVLERMHSKFLGHQLLELLTDSACQAIEQQGKLYTWANLSGHKEEVGGLTILALIFARI